MQDANLCWKGARIKPKITLSFVSFVFLRERNQRLLLHTFCSKLTLRFILKRFFFIQFTFSFISFAWVKWVISRRKNKLMIHRLFIHIYILVLITYNWVLIIITTLSNLSNITSSSYLYEVYLQAITFIQLSLL